MSDALERKTAYEWNRDPRNKLLVMSWSDFGNAAAKDGVDAETLITWDQFRRYRSHCSVVTTVPWRELGPDD